MGFIVRSVEVVSLNVELQFLVVVIVVEFRVYNVELFVYREV